MCFDIFPANVRISRDVVDVQLQGIRARLLDVPRSILANHQPCCR